MPTTASRRHIDAFCLIAETRNGTADQLFKRALRRDGRKSDCGGAGDAYVADCWRPSLRLSGNRCRARAHDPRSVLPQLQAMAPYPVHPIVRPVSGSVESIKQYLDIGAQTLIIPMVETPEQARQMVAATRYPTRGVRGSAAPWRAHPDGTRSTITYGAATTKCACSSKWSRSTR